MLLRSSSTPVLGSLLSSFPETPNNFDHHNRPPSSSDHLKKVSFSHHVNQTSYHHFSCNSSPITPDVVGLSDYATQKSSSGAKEFRRVRSDGNLEGLSASELNDFHFSGQARFSGRHHSVLDTVPSFSAYTSRSGKEYEEEDEEEEDAKQLGDSLERSVTIGKSITALGQDFSFSNGTFMTLVEEVEGDGSKEILSMNGIEAAPLFLSRGLEIDMADCTFALAVRDGNSSGGGNFRPFDTNGNADESDLEDHYKRMVEENPCSGLYLRNYAQFLYQIKKDLPKAEEFYSRGILAEPGDGEIVSQYAKLIWELHRDRDLAASYFELAVQAAPDDSHVLAAYSSFLWDTEDEEGEEEDEELQLHSFAGVQVSPGPMASARA